MIDIHSKSPYPADKLSNFYPHPFVIDGVKCASMEGFLQSLKFKDSGDQVKVCGLSGGEAKDAGLDQDWKTDQTLYWQGRAYDRASPEYHNLITRAFDKLATEPDFQKALVETGDNPLDHTIGIDDPAQTVLTRQEFIDQLYRIRQKL